MLSESRDETREEEARADEASVFGPDFSGLFESSCENSGTAFRFPKPRRVVSFTGSSLGDVALKEMSTTPKSRSSWTHRPQ